MCTTADLYNTSYSHYDDRTYQEVRQETYGLDLGQTSWMTAEEFRSFFDPLGLTPRSHVLEVGCGAGGCAIYLAQTVGAKVTGIDINESAIKNATTLAGLTNLSSCVRFEQADAAKALPFPDQSFDAIYSNDTMCHIADRVSVLKEWRRLLKPGGRTLFTDAMVMTGMISNEEAAMRSSIGFYVFLPPGENERLIAEAGIRLLAAKDLTVAEERISERWHSARERRRDRLLEIEGETNFSRLQQFLRCVYTLSKERRLSRFMYLGCGSED